MSLYAPAIPREREYLYIDGGCLRNSVMRICQTLFSDENAYDPLVSGLATGAFNKIFYYDAVPGIAYGEQQAAYEARVQVDHDRFARIQALDRVHVVLGKIVGQNRRQKGVDVHLAVDMMTHAFRGNIAKATLFAADADFVPLVKALVAEGLHVTLWHPLIASSELKGAADSTRLFDFKSDYGCFTRDGEGAAFYLGASTSGHNIQPADEQLTNVVAIGNSQFAGSWRKGVLKIWHQPAESTWSNFTLLAPDASLPRALAVFDVLYNWGIAETGERWIKT